MKHKQKERVEKSIMKVRERERESDTGGHRSIMVMMVRFVSYFKQKHIRWTNIKERRRKKDRKEK